MKDNTNIKVFS